MQTYQQVQLDFEDFPVVMHSFLLPEHTIWYRAADYTEPTLTNVPRFFGSYRTSAFYADLPDRTLKAYSSTRALRLLDMRHVQGMMRMMVASRRTPQVSESVHIALEILNVALGLCSFGLQLQILKIIQSNALHPELMEAGVQRMAQFAQILQNPRSFPTWLNYIEAAGVRVGITDIDYMVMEILKKLFEGVADGILAPVMRTPFHDHGPNAADPFEGRMLEELVLFNPEHVLAELQQASAARQAPRLLLSAFLRDQYHAVQHADEHMEMPLIHTARGGRFNQKGGRELERLQSLQALAERDSLENVRNPKNIRYIKALSGWIDHVHETFPFFFQYNPVISQYISPYKKATVPSKEATRVGYIGYGGAHDVPR
jgi:hypothetical protein